MARVGQARRIGLRISRPSPRRNHALPLTAPCAPPLIAPPQSQPLYKTLYDTTSTLSTKFTEAPLVGKAYTFVAPLADPVVANFTNSKVIKQLEDTIKPKVA